MLNDIQSFVVGVLVDGTLRGTGYVAADRLVVTCAHVLTDALSPPGTGISVRFHSNGKEVPAEVLTNRWSPSSKDDIAVLALRFEPGESLPTTVAVAALGRSAERKNRVCEVFGYPQVAKLHGLGGRAKIIECVRELEGRKLLQLESTHATSGYSGSPLLDPRTGEVIGTVVEIADQARSRYANHLHSRLEDLAFATPMEVIVELAPELSFDPPKDFDAHKKALARVRTEISRILFAHQDASNYLATLIGGMGSLSDDAKGELVVEHLLNESLMNFLPLILKAYTAHLKSRPELAEAFREIASYVLPQIYKQDLLREIRRRLTAGDNFLVIPSSHKSVIELIVAGALGQKLTFADDWKFDGDIPPGKLEIAAPAELGILEGKTMTRFIEGFERAILAKIGGLPGKMPDPTKAINRKLEKLKEGEPPIRYYYVYRSGQSRVPDLETQYPAVVFVSHELTGHDDIQFDMLDCLKDMFCPEGDQ